MQEGKWTCPKHGDVTGKTVNINIERPTNPPTVDVHAYCFFCLIELMDSFIEEGLLQRLTLDDTAN